MGQRSSVFALVTLSVCIACVTINVYFPEAEIKDLSQVIEEQIRKQAAEQENDAEGLEGDKSLDQGDETQQEEKTEGQQGDRSSDQGDEIDMGAPRADLRRGNSRGVLDLLLGVRPAYAQSVAAPEVTNPAIRAIIASRAGRLERVNAFKSQGVVGENNKARLEARNLDSLSDLKARAELTRLIRDENADREKLFKEIAAVKGVDGSQVSRIAETYAVTLRGEARPGHWIQMPDGTWKQK